MRRSRPVLVTAALLLALAGAAFFGCSKAYGPANPSGGRITGDPNGFDSGPLDAPARFEHVFPNAGTVHYHCSFHVSMGMVGSVTVVTGAADSAVVTASGISFVPQNVSIKPGGFVRWNVTEGRHTVTSDFVEAPSFR